MILVHRCFNQQAGETKSDHCFCERIKEQISRRQADRYVREGKADWLKGWNGKAKKFVEYRVAIVSRWKDIPLDDGSGNVRQQACSVPYGPAYIEAVVGPAPDVPPIATANAGDCAAPCANEEQRRQRRRLIRHEKIKVRIRVRARKLLKKVSPEDFTDADLDDFFQHPEVFYRRFPGRVAYCTKILEPVLTHYWNNILGRDHLSTEAGLMMKQADRGMGLPIYHPPGKLQLMSDMGQADELYGGKRVHCPQQDENNDDDNGNDSEHESDYGQDELTLAYDAVSEFDARHKTFHPTVAEIEEWNCAVIRDARRRERRNPNKTFRWNEIDAVPYD